MRCQTEINLHDGPIPVGPLLSKGASSDDATGAECVFIGRTRAARDAELGDLEALDYHAYRPMAKSVMEDLAVRLGTSHGCHRIVMWHSVGRVAIGEVSVLIRVLTGHRNEAFCACHELINELKRTAPIWKRDCYQLGDRWQPGTPVDLREGVLP